MCVCVCVFAGVTLLMNASPRVLAYFYAFVNFIYFTFILQPKQ